MAYATINPYTGEKIVEFPFSTDDEVKNALETGGKAFSSWRGPSLTEAVFCKKLLIFFAEIVISLPES